ncbi:ATP-binding cassette sub-family C member 5-like [Haliotis rufescens]|uniref:ATP-binding cassette sub-family C member 5-like n=1 Tax=Haliotis rufescens TaxID=6454 RepID=UPI00201ECB15|nr:ATP-binding cassette sub-family C member 5-like [Haliotis rufescens]XP_046379799.2 ATP-binding cassette sub-family C member 5-like [Haliotis rufescens]XP_046379800.2 ATP-binding cassette sub-family C member 5-like [Haliotis rufescens]
MDVPTEKKNSGRTFRRSISQSFERYGIRDLGFDKVPITYSSLLSLATCSWLTPIMLALCRRGGGGLTSVLRLQWWPEDTTQHNIDLLEECWKAELKTHGEEKASLGRAIRAAFKQRLICSQILVVISMVLSFVASACILRLLLDHVSSAAPVMADGAAIVVGLILCEVCRSLTFSCAWTYNYWNGMKVRSATMGLLYKKILRLKSLKDKKIGELVNLFSNDGQRFFEVMVNGPFIMSGPIIFIAGSVYLGFLIGPWALIGCATYVIFFIVLKFVADLNGYFRQKAVTLTGERVSLMTEVLTCMKLIKMNAWENAFFGRISNKRLEEQRALEHAYFLQSVMTSLVPMIPVVASVFMFLSYIMAGNNLTATQAFTLISVLYSISLSLALMAHGLRTLAEASVSTGRYKEVLVMEEIQSVCSRDLSDEGAAVTFHNATLGWESDNDDDDDVSQVEVIPGIKTEEMRESKRLKMERAVSPTFETVEEENGDIVDGSTVGLLESVSVIERASQLSQVSLRIQEGQLIGICGMKGSGKSSLLSALLGRMQLQGGRVGVKGRVAYVSQEPWIFNGTAKDNILFGNQYDKERYDHIIEVCCLEKDFETFGAGDGVEIGDRGLTLSGGQKQRLSLARALYSDSDVYLLDDPMSALDVQIGRHIFNQCIKDLLKDKTVLFVTHHLEYLCRCDYVIYMKCGRVSEAGVHGDLMSDGGDYADLQQLYQSKYDEIQRERIKAAVANRQERTTPQRGFSRASRKFLNRHLSRMSTREGLQPQFSIISNVSHGLDDYEYVDIDDLVSAQDVNDSKVSLHIYHKYIMAAGGYCAVMLIFFSFILSIGLQTAATWWLSYWLDQGDGNHTGLFDNSTVSIGNVSENPDIDMYALIYGLFIVSLVVAVAIRGIIFMKIMLRASSRLHQQLLKKTIKSQMKFFDTTPLGIILNRYAMDMDEIDVRLPSNCELFLQNVFLVLFALVMISVVFPWDLLVILPLAIVFIVLTVMFAPVLQRLKYVDNVTRSPYLSHLAATIDGISTIHVYGQSQRFIRQFCDMLDKNSLPFFLFYAANRWLALFLDLMTIAVIGATGFLVVFTLDSENSANAGLALSFAIQITSLLQYTLRLCVETNSRFTSVKRIQDYIENLPEEGSTPAGENGDIPDDWPSQGQVRFRKYNMKYHEGLQLSLKNISLNICPHEKIGIVGKSGSGKSSLGVALFRLCETTSGAIEIDGKNIRDVKLSDLRSRLSILVQDPVLFVGTIRYNLDPSSQCHDDAEMWEALEKCHIKQKIASLDKQLDTQVDENGRNFSMGEKQLLCLARTLLRHTKILILDEATAAVDTQTEAVVQQTIKKAFKDCTVLTIAHRLTTVLDSDKILVMDSGKNVEFDAPSMLLRRNHSKFKSMVEALKPQSRDSNMEESLTEQLIRAELARLKDADANNHISDSYISLSPMEQAREITPDPEVHIVDERTS